MRLPFGMLPAVCAGTLLATIVANSGCSSAAQPVAQSPAPESAPASREATAPAAPILPEDSAGGAPTGLRLIEFIAVGRGDRIADLGAGRGYSIAQLSEKVGPAGVVYVRHDPKLLHDLPSETASEAPATSALSNVIQMDTPILAPFSPDAKQLDCATLLFGYHELVAEGRDRQRFNAAVLRALKPGGLYIVADHSPTPAAGQAASRVDPRVVRADAERAGFRFLEAADFLSPPTQASAGTEHAAATSQYVLKFQKPR